MKDAEDTKEIRKPNLFLRRQREMRGWSQKKVALELQRMDPDAGVTERNVARWERGKGRPGPYYREKLCLLFGVKADELGFIDSDPVLPESSPSDVVVPGASPLPLQSPSLSATAHRGIKAFPPLTNPKTIQQREDVVSEVYAKLTLPNVTAVALTGIGGVGKSTLAALVYHYAEEQRRAGNEMFAAEALWFRIDPAVTMTDLAGSLFEALEKPFPDFNSLSPHNQALVLIQTLNSVDTPRLIVLDQFENLLDWQTGQALTDRPGIGEWLDVLNSQQCTCRILLTSRPWPRGTREYPPTYMQEYQVEGLKITEGVELLQKQGVEAVQASEAELRTAVERCAGHAFALTLLASLLRHHRLSLGLLFKDQSSTQLWTGDIAHNMLDYIYVQQLDQVQRKLLLALSLYREPVPLEAARTVMEHGTELSSAQFLSALNGLLAQRLLVATGDGYYQLHVIVATYAQSHFDERSEQANQEALRTAHARAAQYYLRLASMTCPPQEQRQLMRDVHPLIEAIWQQCQAEQWREASHLILQEGIFFDLNRWGSNAILLELYQLLLRQPNGAHMARIYSDLGLIYNALGQRQQARKCHEEALRIYREVGDRGGEGVVLNHLGWAYNALGRKKEARQYCEQALDILREIGDRAGESRVLNNLGRIYNVLGQRELAREYHEEALKIYRELGDRWGEGTALNNLGWVSNALRRQEEAHRYCEEALIILREVRNRGGEGRVYNTLGRISYELGQWEQAQQYYEKALSILKEVGDRGGEGKVLNNLGRISSVLGRQEDALNYCEEALDILKEAGDRWGEGAVLNTLGWVQDALDRQEEAFKSYKKALDIVREVGDRLEEGATLQNVGMLYLKQRRYDLALACFLLAKVTFEEMRSLDREEVQRWIDRLCQEVGEEESLSLFAQVELHLNQIAEQALGEAREAFIDESGSVRYNLATE